MAEAYTITGVVHQSQIPSAQTQISRILEWALAFQIPLEPETGSPHVLVWSGVSDCVRELDLLDAVLPHVEWLSLRVEGASGFVQWPV